MCDKETETAASVDMSSDGISSRLREVSELYELGQSLKKAKPMSASARAPMVDTQINGIDKRRDTVD